MAFLMSVFPGLRNIRICEKSGNMGEPHKIKKIRNLFIPDSYRNLDAGVFGPDFDIRVLLVARQHRFCWRNFNKRSLFTRLRFILLFPSVQGIRMQIMLFAVFSAGNVALQVSLHKIVFLFLGKSLHALLLFIFSGAKNTMLLRAAVGAV